MTTETSVPVAELVAMRHGVAVVRCPYCHREHSHAVTRPGGTEHRAPACGMTCSPDQRATGYRFTTTTRTTNPH